MDALLIVFLMACCFVLGGNVALWHKSGVVPGWAIVPLVLVSLFLALVLYGRVSAWW